MSSNSLIAIFTVLGIVILLGGVFLYPKSPYANGALDGFAQCLASKGITMYGTYWCPHCQNEKAAFGSSFKYVNYVECTKEIVACESANIQGYPTWTFPASPASPELQRGEPAGGPDGRRFEGEQGLEKLSAESGCPLPAPASSTKN